MASRERKKRPNPRLLKRGENKGKTSDGGRVKMADGYDDDDDDEGGMLRWAGRAVSRTF